MTDRILYQHIGENDSINTNVLNSDLNNFSDYDLVKVYTHQSSITELLIVDTSAKRYEESIFYFERKGLDLHFLNRHENGLEQLTEILARYSSLKTVHLITHSNETSINLGNTPLDAESLESHKALIKEWTKSFCQEAQLKLYACDVTASDKGKDLLSQLSSLLAVHIAAPLSFPKQEDKKKLENDVFLKSFLALM